MTLSSVNPATGKLIARYEEMAPEQINAILQRAHHAFQSWKRTSFAERSSRMRQAAAVLRDGRERYARLMAQEMGKPVRQGRAEADKCAWVCDYYAEHAERMLANEKIETEQASSYVSFEPLGVVLAIMPWNFPLWQVFRFAAPALMAGNAAVLKHASNVSGCALAIEEVFQQARFPADVFRALLVSSRAIDAVIEHTNVAAVTLTGSTPAGRSVASKAGSVLKKTVLELGGSDAYVVLEDADVEQAASICATSRLINAGQSCIAAKRFVVVEPVRERFEAHLVQAMKATKMGDPLEEATDIGPLARLDLRDELDRQVRESVQKGARLLLGGAIPKGAGAYYPPTVLTGVSPGMPAFDQELFGPVAAIIPARDEQHAIEIANASVYGLGAAVFTRDVQRGERIAEQELEAGCCVVNDLVRSDPRLPFGGIKQSGYGRELSHYGIKEFVNVKTVYRK